MLESLRARVGWRLRRIADRIDPANTPRCTGYSFTIEPGEGIRWRDDGRGCPLWYLSEADYQRAHDEADGTVSAALVSLQFATAYRRPGHAGP